MAKTPNKGIRFTSQEFAYLLDKSAPVIPTHFPTLSVVTPPVYAALYEHGLLQPLRIEAAKPEIVFGFALADGRIACALVEGQTIGTAPEPELTRAYAALVNRLNEIHQLTVGYGLQPNSRN